MIGRGLEFLGSLVRGACSFTCWRGAKQIGTPESERADPVLPKDDFRESRAPARRSALQAFVAAAAADHDASALMAGRCIRLSLEHDFLIPLKR